MKTGPSSAVAAVVLAVAACGASAQDAAQDAVHARATDPSAVRADADPARVGDATQRLLALQRGGGAASSTPRPIAGDVATLSYQRYLDSFRRPIPEHFSTTVRGAGGAGATGGTRPAQ